LYNTTSNRETKTACEEGGEDSSHSGLSRTGDLPPHNSSVAHSTNFRHRVSAFPLDGCLRSAILRWNEPRGLTALGRGGERSAGGLAA